VSVSWSWRGLVWMRWVRAGIGDDGSAGTNVHPGHEAVVTA
jgi:hypothetical protein